MKSKKAKAYIYVNGKLEMHRLVDVDKWLGSDLKPSKKEFKINYPTKVLDSGNVTISFSPAYISIFSSMATKGAYMIISLFNPIFCKVDGYPVKTLAAASMPEMMKVPYA